MFIHIVDDYYLQGILASMKQKEWWIKQPSYNEKYKYDYIWALLMHAFSWSFMIMLPPLYLFKLSFNMIEILILFIANICLHAITDDLKANRKQINLIQDQLVHINQIIFTALTIYITLL
jgi:hypothetical protein